MIIAMEGLNGSGKTTIGKALSRKIDAEFIERPLAKCLGLETENFYKWWQDIEDNNQNRDIVPWMFGLGLLWVNGKTSGSNDIVVDRHILSTYLYDGNSGNESIFEALLNNGGKPDISLLLSASAVERFRRIKVRDKDFKYENPEKMAISENNGEEKMIKFADTNGLAYQIIDTENATLEDSVLACELAINSLKHNLKQAP